MKFLCKIREGISGRIPEFQEESLNESLEIFLKEPQYETEISSITPDQIFQGIPEGTLGRQTMNR